MPKLPLPTACAHRSRGSTSPLLTVPPPARVPCPTPDRAPAPNDTNGPPITALQGTVNAAGSPVSARLCCPGSPAPPADMTRVNFEGTMTISTKNGLRLTPITKHAHHTQDSCEHTQTDERRKRTPGSSLPSALQLFQPRILSCILPGQFDSRGRPQQHAPTSSTVSPLLAKNAASFPACLPRGARTTSKTQSPNRHTRNSYETG